MANTWFRLHAEMLDDPKVQMLPEAMRWRWVAIMCMRCSETLETLHDAQIAFRLRISLTELDETKKVFLASGFIDEHWDVINWDRRQYVSDSSTERVRRYRERKNSIKTLFETDGNVTVTPPEQNRTETEQIQKQSKKQKDAPPFVLPEWIDSTVWNAFVEMRKRKKAPLTEHAKGLALKDLIGLEAKGHKAEDVLNQSIMKCWSGLFEVKTGGNNGRPHATRNDPTNGNLGVLQEVLAEAGVHNRPTREPGGHLPLTDGVG